MTLSDINLKVDTLTGDNNRTQYPNAKRLVDLNLWLQKVAGMIFDSQDETDYDDQRRSDYPIKTTPITTNRDYSIPVPEKVLKIKDISISYDGSSVWRATPIDHSEMDQAGIVPASASAAQTKLDSSFSKTAPRYDTSFNSFWIYPRGTAQDVANGGYIIVEWDRQPLEFTLSDLTDGSAIPGFDDTFHPILAYGMSFEFCMAKNMPQAKNYFSILQDYEARLRRQYSSKQLDRHYQLAPLNQSMK